MVHSHTVCSHSQIELKVVSEERADCGRIIRCEVVELGQELFDVRVDRKTVSPRIFDAVKQTVRVVESPVLKTQLPLWVLSD